MWKREGERTDWLTAYCVLSSMRSAFTRVGSSCLPKVSPSLKMTGFPQVTQLTWGRDGVSYHLGRPQSLLFPLHHSGVLTLHEPEAGSEAEQPTQLTVREGPMWSTGAHNLSSLPPERSPAPKTEYRTGGCGIQNIPGKQLDRATGCPHRQAEPRLEEAWSRHWQKSTWSGQRQLRHLFKEDTMDCEP